MLTLADILDAGVRKAAPGPRGHALPGSLPAARRDPIRLFMESFRDYGDVVRFRFGALDEIGGYEIAECIGNGFAMMEAELVLATLAQRSRQATSGGRG